MNNRIDHIKALERSLINETAGVSEFQMKSISKVINTLNFITNKEYDNLFKTFKGSDKDNFMVELTQFLIDDIRWVKIANKRRTEYNTLKEKYMTEKGEVFKVEDYIYLLEEALPLEKDNREDYLDYLNDNLNRSIGVPDVANAIGTSRRNLEVRFREHLHCSVHAKFRQMRVKQAEYLLKHSDESIETIAALTGFSHLSNFSNTFKANRNVTPSKFRRSRS